MRTRHRIASVAVLTCLISTLLFSYLVYASFQVVAQNQNIAFLKFEVNEVFVGSLKQKISFTNPSPSKIVGGKLFVPLIRNETSHHYAVLCNISSLEGRWTILSDGFGNKYVYGSNIMIGAYQTFTVELNYYVLSFNTRYLINSSLIGDYDTNSDVYQNFTQPEKLIQSDHPEIRAKAENLTKGESDPHAKVLKIYNFVIQHLRYVLQEDERGALWAFKNRTGDCSEFSYLFVALCRAAGIPARIQAGFAFQSLKSSVEYGHMWAEYYLENYGWIPVDATWRLFDSIDCRHFCSIQSIPEFMPYANYFFNYTVAPMLNEKQNVYLKPISTDAFDDAFTENLVKAVRKVNQAKFTFFLAQIFGVQILFSSEAQNMERELLESKLSLQNAIEIWETNTHLAKSKTAEAFESAEAATSHAWTLIAQAFILFISIPIVILLVFLVLLKRHQIK